MADRLIGWAAVPARKRGPRSHGAAAVHAVTARSSAVGRSACGRAELGGIPVLVVPPDIEHVCQHCRRFLPS